MNARIQRSSARARLAIAITASLTVFGTAATVHAADAREASSVSIRYSAREASTDLGAQRLYRRLQTAARTACQPYESRELAKLAIYNTCYQQALADAVENVNLATLRNVYKDKEHSAVRVADAATPDRHGS